MAGYRRFIAYVYEYPQGKKGEGRGFIKVESRDGVCRMHYKLTGIYGRQSAPAKVYGYVRREQGCVGVLLGSCDLAGSSVQFELETEDENMGGSGYQLGDLCGLVLLTETGEMYGSGWDDKQVNLSEIRLPAEKRKIVEYPTEIKAAEAEAQAAECTLPETLEMEEEEMDFRELKLPEEDMERGKKAAENMNREETGEFPEGREERREFPEGREESGGFQKRREEERVFPEGREGRREFPEEREEGRVFPERREVGRVNPEEREEGRMFPEERGEGRVFPERREEAEELSGEREESENSRGETGSGWKAGTERNERSQEGKEAGEYRRTRENGEEQRHEMKEKEDWERGTQKRDNWNGTDQEWDGTDVETRDNDRKYGEIWKTEQKELREQSAPAVQREFMPFSDNSISECRKISPADFRLLQGRDRGLVKNSFLRHGFSQYGHLLTGRREEDGHYILGVPGVYERQEALMAGMYGFPYFKETGGSQNHSRRFGYWYRLIDAPDSDRQNRN